MSAANLTVVKFCETSSNNGDPKWIFIHDRCRHCDEPECIGQFNETCPAKAIKRNSKSGLVWIKTQPSGGSDKNYCGGPKGGPNHPDCQTVYPGIARCQLACPFKTLSPGYEGMPRYKYTMLSSPTVLETTGMMKCDLCQGRFGDADLRGDNDPGSAQAGGRFRGDHKGDRKSNIPACALACPTGAISYGKAGRMLKKVKRRVKKLISASHREAHVYPDGPPEKPWKPGYQTHVVWVLPVARSKIVGWPS
jgi:Fe-S-cluster-containing dehydrogenase component